MINIKKYSNYLLLSASAGFSLALYMFYTKPYSLLDGFLHIIIILVLSYLILLLVSNWIFNICFILKMKGSFAFISISLYPFIIFHEENKYKITINFHLITLLDIYTAVKMTNNLDFIPFLGLYKKILKTCKVVYFLSLFLVLFFFRNDIYLISYSVFLFMAHFYFLSNRIFGDNIDLLFTHTDDSVYLLKLLFLDILNQEDYYRYNVLKPHILLNLNHVIAQKIICICIVKSILNEDCVFLSSDSPVLYNFFENNDDDFPIQKNFMLFNHVLAYLKYFHEDDLYNKFIKLYQCSIIDIVNVESGAYFTTKYIELKNKEITELYPKHISLSYKNSYFLKTQYPFFMNKIKTM